MRMSSMLARCKRGLKDFLMVLLETGMQEKSWLEVTMARARLRDIMRRSAWASRSGIGRRRIWRRK